MGVCKCNIVTSGSTFSTSRPNTQVFCDIEAKLQQNVHQFKHLQQLSFKLIIPCLACMLAILVLLNVATAHIPDPFWYLHYLAPCLWFTTAKCVRLISCNPIETNVMGLSYETWWTKPMVHTLLSLPLNNLLPLWWNADEFRHVAVIYFFLLQAAVIHSHQIPVIWSC